jgi:ABC-type transporter MlaC component
MDRRGRGQGSIGPRLGLRFFSAALLSAALALRPAGADAKEELGPMAKLRRADAELRSAVSRHVPDWSPEADMRRRQIERLLGALLDYDEIARVALGPSYVKLAPERRRTFITTFAALTRRNFIAKLQKEKTQTNYEEETIDGSQARVTATACPQGARPDSRARIEYRLARKGNDWMVVDVVVDGTSLVATYQRQFRRLVEREGMDGLMVRMKEQLASATAN